MKRAVLFTSLAVAALAGPAAAYAQTQQPQGQKQGTVSPQARQAAIEQCRAMFTGNRRAADNASVRMEQCVKEKLGKK